MNRSLRTLTAVAATGLALLAGTGTGTASAAVTPTQMSSLRLPAGHPCEYLGPDFEGPVALRDGTLTDGMATLSLKRSILTDADGDGRRDGIAVLRCVGITGPHTSMVAVRYDGRTGPATVVPFRADAEARLASLAVGFTTNVALSTDRTRLTVDAVAFRPTDALAHPTASVRVVYRLGGVRPVLVSATQTG